MGLLGVSFPIFFGQPQIAGASAPSDPLKSRGKKSFDRGGVGGGEGHGQVGDLILFEGGLGKQPQGRGAISFLSMLCQQNNARPMGLSVEKPVDFSDGGSSVGKNGVEIIRLFFQPKFVPQRPIPFGEIDAPGFGVIVGRRFFSAVEGHGFRVGQQLFPKGQFVILRAIKTQFHYNSSSFTSMAFPKGKDQILQPSTGLS